MKNLHFLILSMSVLLISNSCVQQETDHNLKVELTNTGEPISEFVYGQFIEHLGNCIYNGIWAELIEDRKFYYPITYNFDPYGTDNDPFWNTGDYKYLAASPWEVIGNANTLKMSKINSYVGEMTPEIYCENGDTSGIRQHGIGLVKGKEYVGRMIYSGDKEVLPIIIQITDGQNSQQIARVNSIEDDFNELKGTFISELGGENLSLEIFSTGEGVFRIGTLSLMPADNLGGWRADVVGLLKELDAPIYRWPGGNFVSGYNWRDGIGEMDKRPPRKNPAWKGIEHNDVGIHEYMYLMELLDSKAFIAVNTGSGNPDEVASQIAYCRSDETHPMGQWRVKNGKKEPFDVEYWAIGNEMYGDWQIGHMPLEEYVLKHNKTAEAVWEFDPNAKLVGVGAVGEWSETMLKISADYMNLISEHHYSREIDTSLNDHINQIAIAIKGIADAHRKYREEIPGLKEKDIRIALDEWNYWYGDYIYGELGVRYHHKDALGIAKGLHEMFRNSDLYFMANYAQTVNVIGCIKTTSTTAGFDATGLPLKLYRHHFGSVPVRIDFTDSFLDVSVALNENKDTISFAFVNSSPESTSVSLDAGNTKLSKNAKQWLISSNDPEAFNVPGEDASISIFPSEIIVKKNRVEVPGLSILLLKFAL
ncbi:MAG: hypothetical protein K9H49_17450 [Bacteroidales bacterium]|nr:hypothetical protein [Bacteroidales bacterium]MCF8390204.1 hypothetical protein [Bacteroidales bacterium]